MKTLELDENEKKMLFESVRFANDPCGLPGKGLMLLIAKLYDYVDYLSEGLIIAQKERDETIRMFVEELALMDGKQFDFQAEKYTYQGITAAVIKRLEGDAIEDVAAIRSSESD